jgi:hypothetical protein
MQMKRARRKFKPLKLTPASRGSGLSDVSENHDYYLSVGLSAEIDSSKLRGEVISLVPSRQSRTSKK